MQTRQWLLRSGLLLSVLVAAGLTTALPAAAQTQKPSTTTTTTDTGKSSTMAARAGEDDAAEFAKLDKNKDGEPPRVFRRLRGLSQAANADSFC